MNKDANISPCGKFRYWLSRTWGDEPPVTFVMANPSTADAAQDDPTIRRCIGFAKRLGHGGLYVVNLYAYRATKPADLVKAGWPVGPFNDEEIRAKCLGRRVIAAWGSHLQSERVWQVKQLLKGIVPVVECLGVTQDRSPRHPLYVPAATEPMVFWRLS